jgi:hypothetical protein
LVNLLLEVGEFVRRFRTKSQFDDLSRASLDLLRVEIRGELAECEWVARPRDPWDANLRADIVERNESMQALRDAITVRKLLFQVLPELQGVELRVYRRSPREELELIVSGQVTPGEEPPKTVRSLAMRAKLLGLRFWMNEGVLEALDREECAVNS